MSDAAKYLTLTEQNFEAEVLESEQPVLVDFWAAWCGPCLQLAPVIEELAKDYEGRVRVGKVNVDENRALATQHRIQGIPALFLFRGGEVVDQLVGNQPRSAIVAALDRLLAEAPGKAAASSTADDGE